MDKNRVAGSIKGNQGRKPKRPSRKAVGDAKLQNDGKTEKAVGRVQSYAIGGP